MIVLYIRLYRLLARPLAFHQVVVAVKEGEPPEDCQRCPTFPAKRVMFPPKALIACVAICVAFARERFGAKYPSHFLRTRCESQLNSHKSVLLMDVEAELSQLAEEFGFGVKHIGTSRWTQSHGAPGERAYVAVTTLEGTPLCIELSTRGWKVRKKRGR